MIILMTDIFCLIQDEAFKTVFGNISKNYTTNQKKWTMKFVRLERGHPMIPNLTPRRHPLEVGVGEDKKLK